METFKSTTDSEAEAKIYDVVGLYLRPPTNAVVLSLDEKTQIQALSCACGSSGAAGCGAGGVMAWKRGRGEGARGRGGR